MKIGLHVNCIHSLTSSGTKTMKPSSGHLPEDGPWRLLFYNMQLRNREALKESSDTQHRHEEDKALKAKGLHKPETGTTSTMQREE